MVYTKESLTEIYKSRVKQYNRERAIGDLKYDERVWRGRGEHKLARYNQEILAELFGDYSLLGVASPTPTPQPQQLPQVSWDTQLKQLLDGPTPIWIK